MIHSWEWYRKKKNQYKYSQFKNNRKINNKTNISTRTNKLKIIIIKIKRNTIHFRINMIISIKTLIKISTITRIMITTTISDHFLFYSNLILMIFCILIFETIFMCQVKCQKLREFNLSRREKSVKNVKGRISVQAKTREIIYLLDKVYSSLSDKLLKIKWNITFGVRRQLKLSRQHFRTSHK